MTEGELYRVDKRKSIIASCLLEAHKILGIPISKEELLNKMSLEKSNISSGMKIVEIKIKKYDKERVRDTYSSPVDSIKDILSKWESDPKTIEEIIKLYNYVDDKSMLLNRSRVKSVASGLIYYYALSTKRTNIKLKEFAKRVELSDSTILKVAREISAILKTPEILQF